jgi:hypothetical protein
MPQPDPTPSRTYRGERRGYQGLLGRRVLVVAVVAGALLGVIGVVSAQEANNSSQRNPSQPTTAPAVRPGSQLDPNNPAQTGERSCRASNLPRHDGFEKSGTCVQTQMGEVSDRSPSALITNVPENAAAGEAFQITASVRNVVRDRFAPAAKGGYYLFMSELNEAGLTHGHAHIYVQNIGDAGAAPDSDAAPLDFFKAVEDGGGGAAPDNITVDVPGLQAGSYRACVTLGDSSHRLPLTKAAKIAAGADCTRFEVGGAGGGGGGGGEEPPTTTTPPDTTQPPATEPPATGPPATEPPATEPPATEPPATEPPATEPPAADPPAADPPATADQGGQAPPATEPPAPPPPAQQPAAPAVDQTVPPTSAQSVGVVDEATGAESADQLVNASNQDGSLPFTGATSGAFLVLGVAMVLGGTAFLMYTDTRKPRHANR